MVDISCINPKSSYWAVYSTHLVETDDYPIADILFIEFVIDGGPAAKALKPKFDISMKHVSSHFGFSAPHVEMRHIVAASIFLKGLEGLLFISSCSFGTCLLSLFLAFTTPVILDFYKYDIEARIHAAVQQVYSEFWGTDLFLEHEKLFSNAGKEKGYQVENILGSIHTLRQFRPHVTTTKVWFCTCCGA
ncbi:uncharacterized protein LOC121975119 isoform X6 [Zingiber officinale]|nr:uncharacterized protein LOC121975119 isoform X6 [Zingiber officinale]